jgi:hypothetical protein
VPHERGKLEVPQNYRRCGRENDDAGEQSGVGGVNVPQKLELVRAGEHQVEQDRVVLVSTRFDRGQGGISAGGWRILESFGCYSLWTVILKIRSAPSDEGEEMEARIIEVLNDSTIE